MTRSDWILLVLNAAGDDALSPVQLQKSVFLIRENFPKTTGRGFYNFRPYNYGPFSATIYSDAEQLSDSGLVEITQAGPSSYSCYSITPAGKKRAALLRSDLKPKARAYVDTVVDWVKSLTFTQLVKAIYDKYPEYRVNSVFRY